MNLKDIRIGISPITNEVYLYEGEAGCVDVDEKENVSNQFIGCLDILLKNNGGNVRFSVDGKDREFWLTEKRPPY